jgi:hypothetical protein
MTRYREQRCSLADSMETVVELPDREAAIRHIRKRSFMAETFLACSPYGGPDRRIDWPRTYVILGENGPLGFADGPLFGGDPEETTVVHTHVDGGDPTRPFLDAMCESMTATYAVNRALFVHLSAAVADMTDEQREAIRRLNGTEDR